MSISLCLGLFSPGYKEKRIESPFTRINPLLYKKNLI